MSRLTYDILVDCDDVFYAWGPRAQRILDRVGISQGKRIKSWSMHEDLDVPAELLWGALDEHVVELYSGHFDATALREMRRLRGYGHRLHIVTARGCHGHHAELIEEITRRQFHEANLPMDSLTFARNKGEVAVAMGLELAIDDGPHNCADLADNGVRAWMMSAWHNHAATYSPRVGSMKQFADLVLFFAERNDRVRGRVA